MIILGIDPGLAHTGWGVIETRGSLMRTRAYGCVTTTADEPIDVRLGRIYNQIVACARGGLTVGEYTPMQIKQAVVGTGSADKHQVIYMVRTVLALDHEPRPDHAADALAAAVCHANLTRTVDRAEQSLARKGIPTGSSSSPEPFSRCCPRAS